MIQEANILRSQVEIEPDKENLSQLNQRIAAIEQQIQQLQLQIDQLKFATDIVNLLQNAHIAENKEKQTLQKQVKPIYISSF